MVQIGRGQTTLVRRLCALRRLVGTGDLKPPAGLSGGAHPSGGLHQSVESAIDSVEESLKLLRSLFAKLRSGLPTLSRGTASSAKVAKRSRSIRLKLITHYPSMKLTPPSQAGAFAPPSVPTAHLPTAFGTPSEVGLRHLSPGALNSRCRLGGGKHLPITFRASPARSERLPSTFRIRGGVSWRLRSVLTGRTKAAKKPKTARLEAPATR